MGGEGYFHGIVTCWNVQNRMCSDRAAPLLGAILFMALNSSGQHHTAPKNEGLAWDVLIFQQSGCVLIVRSFFSNLAVFL